MAGGLGTPPMPHLPPVARAHLSRASLWIPIYIYIFLYVGCPPGQRKQVGGGRYPGTMKNHGDFSKLKKHLLSTVPTPGTRLSMLKHFL